MSGGLRRGLRNASVSISNLLAGATPNSVVHQFDKGLANGLRSVLEFAPTDHQVDLGE